jgi:hypothetical protein
LLIGAVPAVYLGARMSAKANDGYIRPVIIVALIFSALKVLDASDTTLKVVLALSALPLLAEIVRVALHDRADREAKATEAAEAQASAAALADA